jgi:SpoIVB peptidase S55
MKKVSLFGLLFLLVASSLFAAEGIAAKAAPAVKTTPKLNVAIMPLNQIKPGMKGVGYTVFEGTKPEAFDVEILGVMNNQNGPKSDLILARLHGPKVEYTGVVAGMSGSPVYIDGKLVGAISYRIGEFSKEPIAGITPIQEMLEIDELDSSVTPPPMDADKAQSVPKLEAARTSGPGMPVSPFQSVTNVLQPIETPLVFSGFNEEAVKLFAPEFKAAGIVPVMGAGSVTEAAQPEPLVPGSAISAIMVRGDLNIAATCTVTYVDKDHLLACGHPLLNFGRVDMPMNKAEVLATLASPANAFKIVNTTERVGAFVQDRHTGIMGKFGEEPRMVPVTLTVHGGPQPKTFHYEVLNNARLTPVAMMSTVFSALQGMNEYGQDISYRLDGRINVAGFPAVTMENMFAPADGGGTTAQLVAASVGERFSQIYENPWARPDIRGVQLDLNLIPERRWAHLETVRTDVTEARPGDEIVVEAVLRPYRGERIVRQIPVRIPTSTPKGTLRILVSDGDTLDRMRSLPAALGRKLDLGSTIALLNKEHSNSNLYVSLMEANPQAMVDDKVMPTVPLSVMNVMDGMRGTQDMVVMAESSVDESSTPLDYVIAGKQVLSVSVK